MATATVTGITDEAQATDIASRTEEYKDVLAQTRGALDQVEAELDDLLVAQSLGQKVDSRTLERLEHKRDEFGRTVRRTQTIIDGLQSQMQTWQADERQRQYGRDLATMTDVANRAPELEHAICEAMAHLVSLMGEQLALQATYDALWPAVERYRHANGLAGTGQRRPASPPIIPEQYYRQAAPYIDFDQWLREEMAARGIGA